MEPRECPLRGVTALKATSRGNPSTEVTFKVVAGEIRGTQSVSRGSLWGPTPGLGQKRSVVWARAARERLIE